MLRDVQCVVSKQPIDPQDGALMSLWEGELTERGPVAESRVQQIMQTRTTKQKQKQKQKMLLEEDEVQMNT